MQNQTIQITRLPAINSSAAPAFSNRDEYLAFVAEWKLVYKELSLRLRLDKIARRQNPNNRPAKAKMLEATGKAIEARLTSAPRTDYVAKGVPLGSFTTITRRFSAGEATWLLALRERAKQIAREQRAQALATRG